MQHKLLMFFFALTLMACDERSAHRNAWTDSEKVKIGVRILGRTPLNRGIIAVFQDDQNTCYTIDDAQSVAISCVSRTSQR